MQQPNPNREAPVLERMNAVLASEAERLGWDLGVLEWLESRGIEFIIPDEFLVPKYRSASA